MRHVELRDATDEDRAFLRDVYGSTREEELARVEWSAEQRTSFVEHQFSSQDAYYKANYAGATYSVIEVDGERAGRLYVARWDTEIRIMDITLLPEFRGLGVGTRLLRRLLDEAQEGAKRVSIHVEENNPARSLYERLGFKWVLDRPPYVLMEWASSS